MINFLRWRFLYLLISLSVLIPGIFSLIFWGVKPSIDFVGGSNIEIKNEKFSTKQGIENTNIELKNIFIENNIDLISIQSVEKNVLLIRTKVIERKKWEEVKKSLEEKFGKIEEVKFETVGPILGKELLKKTFYAAVLAIFGILLYIAWAFKDIKYGISAVLALFHDVLVLFGIFSLLGHFYNVEVDILFITAVLTTMSFSVHDTIVVFDRIRESLKKEEDSFSLLVNKALTETMSRSLNNSMTIIFMLLALILLGGANIRWFVTALLIGTISGTYSSPFVAVPILDFIKNKEQ